MKKVLVTGGAGFIGTHILARLAANGYECLSIDNYSNSSPRAIERVRRIAGNSIKALDVDIRDEKSLRAAVVTSGIDSVIHLAGLKAVGESVSEPLRYYDNNVTGTVNLLKVLAETPARRFVFSSSATVYGAAERMPITEDTPTRPENPYGETKLVVEGVLRDLAHSDSSWRVMNLRYFNPVGAHPSGLIGEDPVGIPNNLMPFICQVAAGRHPRLRVFGNDYPTNDGTGIRDYIHVMDLAEGHVAALKHLERESEGRETTLNLGTGRGYSVLEVLRMFERVTGLKIPYEVVPRRPGDAAICYADASLAQKVLGWQATRDLQEMCADAWRWQMSNPRGYNG